MLDCAGGPTSEKATIMIMLAARRAYELDMILLIRYWFIKRTNEIRRAPIVEHNEKAVRLFSHLPSLDFHANENDCHSL